MSKKAAKQTRGVKQGKPASKGVKPASPGSKKREGSGKKDGSLPMAELQALAHAGTDEALRTLEAYLDREEDMSRRMLLDMALSECSFFRYQPENEQEDEDLLLRLVIRDRERQNDETVARIEKLQDDLERYAVEKKVTERLAKKGVGGDEKGRWELAAIADMMTMTEHDIAEAEASLAYDEAWIDEARAMIRTEKYRDMPDRALGFFDEQEEDDDGEDDDDERCDCGFCA